MDSPGGPSAGGDPRTDRMAGARRRRLLAVAALASLANGIALLGTILFTLPLPLLLVLTWTIGGVALTVIIATSSPAARAGLAGFVVVGLVAGVAATLAYDVAKALLSQLDPSPFNPFEAIVVFGHLLLGRTASRESAQVVGGVFHLLNGFTFAIAYTMLAARAGRTTRARGLLTGIGWGLFLELFQLTLYPGWLSVRFLEEFRQISFLGHIVYGAVLGLLVPAGLGRVQRRARTAREVDA